VFSLASGRVFGVLQRGVVDHAGRTLPNLTKAEPVYPVFEHDSLKEMKNMKIPKNNSDCAGLMKKVGEKYGKSK